MPGFELQGSFELVNNPNEIRVTVNASFQAFGTLFLGINGTIAIVKGSNPGLVIDVGAYLKSGFFGIDGVFDLNATFQMKLNTRSGDGSDQYDHGVRRGYARIAFAGSMKLLGAIDIQANGYIEGYLGIFRVEINAYADILGQSIYGSGYLSSEGEFRLAFGGRLQIGPPGFGVSGSAHFEISRLDGNGTEAFGDGNYYVTVYGKIEASIQIFGITLLGASIEFGLEGPTGRVYITPKVKILFWEISTTFNLFYIKVPPPVYLAGNGFDTGPAVWEKGQLHLNIGRRANFRNINPNEVNEGITVNRLGDDPDYPGEILQIEAFGRRQNFRGVTSIVADGGSGHDQIEIGPGVRAPVYIRGGDSKDYIIMNGAGPAVIEGGEGDDDILVGSGTNHLIFGDGAGQDILRPPTSPGPSHANTFDFSTTTEGLAAEVNNEELSFSPDSYNDKILGTGTIGGRNVKLVPTGGDTVIAVLQDHGLEVGDTFNLVTPDIPGFGGEYEVTSVSEDSFTFETSYFMRSKPRGIVTSQGMVFHDGNQTAYLVGSLPDWQPDQEVPFRSSARGYNGLFQLTKLGDYLYSFQVPFDDVRTGIRTNLKASTILLGSGDDELTIPGNYNGVLQIDTGAGGFDTLRISGSLMAAQKIVPNIYQNYNLTVYWTGFDQIDLIDPGMDITISGATPTSDINLGGVSLGIVARSVTIPVGIATPSLEINVRDSLSITRSLNIIDLNLRVFGDNQNITLTSPVVRRNPSSWSPQTVLSTSPPELSSHRPLSF
ncbi:MAG UNVERIFIED_CONTAM: hypothetical protein LVR18_47755 [Planctomycetaceae bacterium]